MHPRFCYYPRMGKSTDQVAAIEKIVCCLFQFRGGAGCALQGYLLGNMRASPKAEGTRGRMTATAFVVRVSFFVCLFVFDGKVGQSSISRFMTS